MAKKKRMDAMNEPGGKTISPSESAGECIARVENGLVTMTENGQPQWDSTATLTERMEHYRVPGVSIAVVDAYAIDWVKGYGVCIASEVEPVTPHTLFHAG
jgi:CubicO group peptidase (beta-lactamase class C family)